MRGLILLHVSPSNKRRGLVLTLIRGGNYSRAVFIRFTSFLTAPLLLSSAHGTIFSIPSFVWLQEYICVFATFVQSSHTHKYN